MLQRIVEYKIHTDFSTDRESAGRDRSRRPLIAGARRAVIKSFRKVFRKISRGHRQKTLGYI